MSEETEQPEFSELLAALKAEEGAALGEDYEAELIQQQREALDHYYGNAYGDEAPGRSQVITREVFETIEWVRPDLVRTFTANGEALCEVEPTGPKDEDFAAMAGPYLNYIFFEDNDGNAIVDAFAFDGLLQKLGVAAAFWEPASWTQPEIVAGINQLALQALDQDPHTAVLDITPDEQPKGIDPALQTFTVTIQRLDTPGKVRIENVAPEDFRVASGTVSLDDCRYCGRIIRTSRSELKVQFPDHAEEIDELSDTDGNIIDDDRRQARFNNMEDFDEHPTEEEVILLEEYIRFDLNGDGLTEMLCVKRVNDLLLEVQEVDEHPFADWTPIPIPHRLHGLSLADVTKDVQRTKTVLLRAALDATYQAVVPRMAANTNTVNMADLLSPRPGGVIRVRGEPRANLQPVQVPDLSGGALALMEFIDQIGESRTGVTRNAQGLDPDALNKTATGIKLMQNAASARKEMIARNLARGLKKLMKKILGLVVRHQDMPRMVRVSGKVAKIDPRPWSAEMSVIVHPGVGTGDKEARITYLQMIMGMQRELAGTMGANNLPTMLPKLHASAERMVQEMGYRSADAFFPRPEQLQPPQPQPDPKIQLEQQKMQLRQQEKQADMQLDQQKAQAEMQMEQAKSQSEIAVEQQRMTQEFELKRMEIQAQLELRERQMLLEIDLKREQMDKEIALKRELGIAGGTSTQVRPGGEPG